MINAGGILGQLTISATAWQQGLAQATQSLQQFTQTTQQLTQQLNQTLNQTAGALGQIQSQLNRATTAAQGHAGAIRNAGEAHQAFGSYVQRATSNLGAFIATSLRWAVLSTTIGAGIGLIRSALQGLGDVTIGFNSQLQTSQIRWENLLGSMEAAQAFMARIQQEAVRTPFDFEHLDQGLARLAAAGVAIRDLIPLSHDLGNALAFSGNMTNEAYDRGIKALANMQTSIRVNAREMNELTRLQIPAWQILADHMGVTTGKLREMVQQGLINRDTFREAFHEWITTDVGDIMSKQSQTFLTALSNIRDGLRFIGATAFRPIFERIAELANRFQEFVQSDDFQKWGGQIAAVVEIVMRALGILGEAFVSSLQTVLTTVSTVGQAIYQAMSWINPFARHSPSLVESVTEGVAEIIDRYQSLAGISDVLESVGQTLESFRQKTQGIGQIQDEKRTQDVGVLGPDVAQSYSEALGAIRSLDPVIAQLTTDWQAQKDVVAGVKTELDEANRSVAEYDTQIRETEASGRDYRDHIADLKDRLTPLKAALDAASDALADQRDRAQAARDAVDPLKQAYDRVTESVQHTRDALSSAKDELNGFLEAPVAGEQEFQNKISGFARQMADLETKIATIEARPGARTAADKTQLDKLRAQEETIRAQERLVRAQREQVVLPVQQERETARHGPEMSVADIQSGLSRVGPQVTALETTLRSQVTAAHDAKDAYDAGIEHAKQLEITAHQMELTVQARQRDVSGVEREIASVQRDLEQNVTRVIDRLRGERDEVAVVRDGIKLRYDDEKKALDDIKGGLDTLKQKTVEWKRATDEVHQSAVTVIAEQKAAAREAAAAAKENATNVPTDPNAKKIDLTEDIAKIQAQKQAFDEAVEGMNAELQPLFELLGRIRDFFQGPLGQALVAAGTSFLLVKGAVAVAETAFGALLTPIGLVVLAILGLSEIWNRNFGQIQQITEELVNGPFKMLGEAMAALSRGDLETFKTLFQAGMADLGTKIRDDLGYWADNFLTWATEMAPPVLEKLGDFAVRLIGWIVEQADVIYQKLTEEWIPAFTDWLQRPETGAISRIGKLLVELLGKIDTWTKDHRDDIEDFFNRWTERLLAFIGHAIEVVAERLAEFLLNIDTWEQTEGGKRMSAIGVRLGEALIEGLMKGLVRSSFALGNWMRGLAGMEPLPVPPELQPGGVPPRPVAVTQAPDIPQEVQDQAAAAAAERAARPDTHPETDLSATVAAMNLATGTVHPPAIPTRDDQLDALREQIALRAAAQRNPYALQVKFDASHGLVPESLVDELISRGPPPARQFGGFAKGRTVVGEAGPEVVDLPQGSFVHPSGTPMPSELPSSVFAGLGDRFKQMGAGMQGPVMVTIDPSSIVQIGTIVGGGLQAVQQNLGPSPAPAVGGHGLIAPGGTYETVAGTKRAGLKPGETPTYESPWTMTPNYQMGGTLPGETRINISLQAGMIATTSDIASEIRHESSRAVRDAQRAGG